MSDASVRYRGNKPSPIIEITETRTGDWIIEAPCGWHQNFGPGLGLSLAKEYARYHRNRCPKCRVRSGKIGYETATQAWREQEGEVAS